MCCPPVNLWASAFWQFLFPLTSVYLSEYRNASYFSISLCLTVRTCVTGVLSAGDIKTIFQVPAVRRESQARPGGQTLNKNLRDGKCAIIGLHRALWWFRRKTQSFSLPLLSIWLFRVIIQNHFLEMLQLENLSRSPRHNAWHSTLFYYVIEV